MTKTLAMLALVVGIGFPQAPSPINQLCYNSPAYRNTHEQECIIDPVQAGSGGNDGGGGPGGRSLIGDIVHSLTGGLL